MMRKSFTVLKVFGAGLAGALIFQGLHLPIPWLLGPIFTVLLVQFVYKGELAWPSLLRNIGLVIAGVEIGKGFDLALFENVGWLFVYMVVLNLGLFAFSLVLAWLATKVTSMSFKTALTSSIPGGLSQLVLFAEEEKDVDIAVVTFFHVIRVIAVVVIVPFIVSGHVVSGGSHAGEWSLRLFVVLALASLAAIVGLKLKLPVAHFLTPILFMIGLALFRIDTPEIPISLLHIAQLFIGSYIGLLLKPQMIRLPRKVLIMGVFSAFALLLGTYGSSVILQWTLHYSFATSFLSTAPGGLDQMGLLASAVHADISIVTVFQLFRLLFIFLVILPLLKYTARHYL